MFKDPFGLGTLSMDRGNMITGESELLIFQARLFIR